METDRDPNRANHHNGTTTRKHEKERSSSKKKKDRRSSDKGSSRSGRHNRNRDHRKRRRSHSPSSSSSASSSSSSSHNNNKHEKKKKKVVRVVANARLLEKLSARGETLEEREQRRAQRRADRIQTHFGYTPDENPFNDPNLHETFQWKKREEQHKQTKSTVPHNNSRKEDQDRIFQEIESVRKRRQDRELQQDEMEKLKADEARMRELANYEEWAKKEEEFHLQQQRQRSAIRLLEHREKPIDVLAKNLLLFALDDEDKRNRSKVKYQERFDALNELENSLEAELVEPHVFLKHLKLDELQELAKEVETFRDLEKEALLSCDDTKNSATSEMIIAYWNDLLLVCRDEINIIKAEGDGKTVHSEVFDDIVKLFEGKSVDALNVMKQEILRKLDAAPTDSMVSDAFDNTYWENVLVQLQVYQAKEQLSEIHNVMLARQLEKLERKKEELSNKLQQNKNAAEEDDENMAVSKGMSELDANEDSTVKKTKLPEGNLEEQLGLADEVGLCPQAYAWQDKYRPRKPRYFNRVKTGYDWNKYNQTHYDHDNPPPKIVQGYKFNVFYPDLIDKTQTAQYFIEPADSDEFCVIRFHAGPPYEDIAFKIINREWNLSRKRGFRCTFERGVLSLYFNFNSHWYRR